MPVNYYAQEGGRKRLNIAKKQSFFSPGVQNPIDPQYEYAKVNTEKCGLVRGCFLVRVNFEMGFEW